ncbi:hypothetical protein DFJ74DRAFT_645012 [Hyaloraphidium curvatum]|nr:hypothetical protein DFJ74DRAFT_645012 [Hyaloraphidium curvatum]
MALRLLAGAAVLAHLALGAQAFYLPGVAPRDYKRGDKVDVWVNAYSSPDTVIPYDYYFEKFHMCPPEGGQRGKGESLGSILFGDRLYDSRFDLRMSENTTCNKLCTAEVTIPAADAKFINERIKEEYSVNWIVDGLPAARMGEDRKTGKTFYSIGFELGTMGKNGRPYLNNHYEIAIQYHTVDDENFRVVGVLVWPFSVKKWPAGDESTCYHPEDAIERVSLDEKADNKVQFTYNVNWIPSAISWATRWDNYLYVFDPKIHWFSLINSVVIVLFLSGMVAMVLLRALHKDIARYNSAEVSEDAQEEFGWKLVHGDVFRPPPHYQFLSVLVGNGAQLFLMASVTLVFAVLGFLSPSSRGSLSTVMLVFYVCFGSVAGYVSARMYKMFGGEDWRMNVILTAFLVPGVIFFIFVILNFFLIGTQSSGAVPFGTMLALICMWFLISAPLCMVGAYFGFKAERVEPPVRTNQIPRQIPEQAYYLQAIPSMLMGGVLPFGAIFIELYFIMNSIWYHRIYYVFGFLFLVFAILILTCSEVTILMCYFHLCAEDYRWWWRAFFTSAASAIYVFLYSILYFTTKLSMAGFVSGVLYFGWSITMSLVFGLLAGTIGFVACLAFVITIFGAIKVD